MQPGGLALGSLQLAAGHMVRRQPALAALCER